MTALETHLAAIVPAVAERATDVGGAVVLVSAVIVAVSFACKPSYGRTACRVASLALAAGATLASFGLRRGMADGFVASLPAATSSSPADLDAAFGSFASAVGTVEAAGSWESALPLMFLVFAAPALLSSATITKDGVARQVSGTARLVVLALGFAFIALLSNMGVRSTVTKSVPGLALVERFERAATAVGPLLRELDGRQLALVPTVR